MCVCVIPLHLPAFLSDAKCHGIDSINPINC